MKDGIFGSRDAQCEKCRLIYRLGDEHTCAEEAKSASQMRREEVMKEEADGDTPDPTADVEEAPKKKRAKKE